MLGELKLQKPSRTPVAQLGECVEIALDGSRIGFISYIMRGDDWFEVMGGDVEAPGFKARKSSKKATPNADDSPDEDVVEDQEETGPSDVEKLQFVREKQLAVTQSLLGDEASVRYRATETVISSPMLPEGSVAAPSWASAFVLAARDAGIWQVAVLSLARKLKSEAYLSKSRLSTLGANMVKAADAREEDVTIEYEPGKSRIVTYLVIAP